MNDVLKRSIWGAVFIVIMVASFIVGAMATATILGLFMVMGVFEFYRFFNQSNDYFPWQRIGVLGAIVLYAALVEMELGTLQFHLNEVLIPLFFIPFLIVFSSKSKHHIVDIALTLFPWIYVTYTFFLMFKIYLLGATMDFHWVYILGMFILVWTNDTLAYCAGRLFGKHKLYESISPKKTWEGAIGGFVFTIIVGYVYALIVSGNPIFWMVAGAVISPASIIGDLIESRFKRVVNIKDSGALIPGHGGILDRFDAAIIAAPFFYLLLLLF